MYSIIQPELASLNAALEAKVHRSLGTDLTFSAGTEAKLQMWYYPVEDGELEYFVCRGEDVWSLFAEAAQYISGLPCVADLQAADLRASLATTIEKARKYDMPLDFINPLTASMKRLSENALEDKREQPARMNNPVPPVYDPDDVPF